MSPDQTHTDSELLESALSEYVIAHGSDQPAPISEDSLRVWLARLPEHLHGDFIECVALAGGLQETQDMAPGDKVRLRRMLRAPIATPCADVDPSRVGRYEIQYVIARRGGSTVYLAFDPELQRFVAIKILPQSEDERAIQRFEREARILAALDHPDIVKVYDSGCEGGRPYLVLEYIEGGDLSDIEAPTTNEERRQEVEHASRLAGALMWLHTQGICHRDIKPSNVLLRPDGRVALADFGLARALDEESSLTGKLLGTPAYMAPEQVRDPSAAGPAADVYSLACLVAERLSGLSPHLERPFTQILRDLDDGRSPLTAEHFDRIPKPLVPTLHACLVPDPRARPDAEELQRDLDSWLAGNPLVLGNRTWAARALHEVHSRRRFLASLGIAGLGLGGLAWAVRAFTDDAGHGDPFDQASRLLFDTGDFPSVLEPVYQMEEGYSPLASLFLEPVTGGWEKRRLEKCESLRSQSDLTPEHGRLLDACIAFRRGDSDGVGALLADDFPGRDGLMIEFVRRHSAGGKTAAIQRIGKVLADTVIDEANPLDAFFLVVALMALWEDQLGPFSHYRRLPVAGPPHLESMRPLIARARQQGGAWRGWTELLATGLTRIGCPELGGRTSSLEPETYLPDSFWVNYVAKGRIIDDSTDANAYLDTWSKLQKQYPEATMVQTLLDYWVYPLHPPSWKKSLDRLFYQERQPALAGRWIGYAFNSAQFDEEAPDGVEKLVTSWMSDHPRSKDLLLYVAAKYLVLAKPLPLAVREKMVESGCDIPQEDPAVIEVFGRDDLLTVQRIPGLPQLLEMQQQLGLLPAVEARPGSHELIWTAVRTSLESLLSARRSALPIWTYRCARVAMEKPHIEGGEYHAIVAWHRLLCPILETQAPVDLALARALQGLAALGPVPVLHHSTLALIQKILKLPRLWTKPQSSRARTRLAEALDLARKLPTNTRAARESLAGVAFTAAHLASQLSEQEALAEARALWETATLQFGLPVAQQKLSAIFL